MANSNDKPELHSAAKFPYYRQLKVRQGYYEYHYNGHTFREHRTPEPVPFILLKGYWLAQANLPIGTELQVTIHSGKIILSAPSNS